MDKKAFEIQFNWMFVLIAGAAILLFFTALVIKQKSISESSAKITVLKSIEAIITGASVSKDTTSIIDIPNSDIKVECNKIAIDGNAKKYQNLVLFAPSFIRGNKILTQTLAFNSPYRAANLLLMTSLSLRYVIVGENAFTKELNKSMPSDLKKDFYSDISQIKNSNDYKVRIVVFGDMIIFPKTLGKMRDSDVSSVRIVGNIEKGTIDFYQKNQDSWQLKGASSYLGKSSLLAAIYSDTLEAYECNMQNVFSRLNLVNEVYKERTANLMKDEALTDKDTKCNQIYNRAILQLNRIGQSSSIFNEQNANAMADASNLLAIENKNVQINSCALIY